MAIICLLGYRGGWSCNREIGRCITPQLCSLFSSSSQIPQITPDEERGGGGGSAWLRKRKEHERLLIVSNSENAEVIHEAVKKLAAKPEAVTNTRGTRKSIIHTKKSRLKHPDKADDIRAKKWWWETQLTTSAPQASRLACIILNLPFKRST